MTQNTQIAEYKKSFHSIYHKEIAPVMREFEPERKKLLGKLIRKLVFMSISAIALIVVSLTFKIWYLLLLPAVIIISCVFDISKSDRIFARRLKDVVMKRLICSFGDINWVPNREVISELQLRSSGIFSDFTIREADDTFAGSYRGVKFEISETVLKENFNKRKDGFAVPVFKGVVINFPMNKTVKNTTIVASRGDLMILGAPVVLTIIPVLLFIFFPHEPATVKTLGLVLILWAAYLLKIKSMKSVKLEDPVFSRKYKVYSSDQVESRYLLTPAFMERLNNIKTAFGVWKIKCSFYNDQLMFAISTNKNVFEIGSLFTPMGSPKQFERFFSELASIFMMIDYFKLDEKTGI